MSGNWRVILLYGALAALLLACLKLVSMAPLAFDWGRELMAAAISTVALVIGLRLAARSAPAPAAQIEMPSGVAPSLPLDSVPAADAAEPIVELLSPRELSVLRLLAEGASNKEIAQGLGVAENTVKTHLANLYAKLGVRRRTEALAEARRRGWP
jgi:DNA-binding NarL/FixJ family response regulator